MEATVCMYFSHLGNITLDSKGSNAAKIMLPMLRRYPNYNFND